MCLAAIYWARLDRVYFANTREDAARIGFDGAWIYAGLPKAPEVRRTRLRGSRRQPATRSRG